MTETAEYVIEHLFDAPPALVWKAWTKPELLSHWYGPGVETIIHKFDLEPGGVWLNEMRWGDKSDRSRIVFQEVVPNERLVWHHSSADSDWNIVSNQMMENWPKVLLTTVTFQAVGDQTKVRLTMVPLEATAEEHSVFASAMAGMSKGWASGFALLEDMLANEQSVDN